MMIREKRGDPQAGKSVIITRKISIMCTYTSQPISHFTLDFEVKYWLSIFSNLHHL